MPRPDDQNSPSTGATAVFIVVLFTLLGCVILTAGSPEGPWQVANRMVQDLHTTERWKGRLGTLLVFVPVGIIAIVSAKLFDWVTGQGPHQRREED